MNNKGHHILTFWGVTLCRILLAGTFLLSGFVKAVDPIGMCHKLNAYFTHWEIQLSDNSVLLFLLAIALSTIEFILGIHLLLGIRKRFCTIATAVFMTVMTGLTIYIYVQNPVPDCGCFGDAIVLTNGETLCKNIVLWIASGILLWKKHYLLRVISERNQWITSLYSYIYIILLSLYSAHYLPILDFSAYKTGTDLRNAYFKGEGDEKTLNDLMTFSIYDAGSGEDMTEALLNDSGYTFLLTLPALDTADDGCNRINDLFDECKDAGHKFYGITGTSADSSAVSDWIDRTGAAYPFLMCDDTTLKAMVRSNPGLILIGNGRIMGKWSNNNLPDPSIVEKGKVSPPPSSHSPLTKLLLWFIMPLTVVILLDRLWIGYKRLRHHKYKQRLKQQT